MPYGGGKESWLPAASSQPSPALPSYRNPAPRSVGRSRWPPAADIFPCLRQPILPPANALVGRQAVLHKEQPAAGSKHAARSPIIPSGRSADAPGCGRSRLESVVNRRLRSKMPYLVVRSGEPIGVVTIGDRPHLHVRLKAFQTADLPATSHHSACHATSAMA